MEIYRSGGTATIVALMATHRVGQKPNSQIYLTASAIFETCADTAMTEPNEEIMMIGQVADLALES